MSKEESPKTTREEYIKATGISGDKLVDDIDKAHEMAKAGNVDRTIAANAKRAGKVIVENALAIDNEFGYGPAHAALRDIRRKDTAYGSNLSEAEQVLLGNYHRKGTTKTYDSDEVKEWRDASYRPTSKTVEEGIDTSVTGFIGRAIDKETGKFPDIDNVEGEIDHLASYYRVRNERADEAESRAAEEYERSKAARKKADELMSKFD